MRVERWIFPRVLPWGANRCCPYVVWIVMFVALVTAQAPKPLEYHIAEEKPSDTFVADLMHDSGLKFQYEDHPEILDQITLEFASQAGEHWDYFYIQRSAGILRTAKLIDREVLCPSQPSCPVHINVIVQPSQFFQIVKITVFIDDINDNEPTFPQRTLLLDISESALLGAAFPVPAAEDLDSGSFGIQRYELQPPSKQFKLQVGNSSEMDDVHLVLQDALDREQRELYVMNIIAYDGGTVALSGFIEVQVTVQDANDNNPRFDNYTYEVEIPETVAVGTTIARLQARDPDAGPNGEVQYSFGDHTEQTTLDVFHIDRLSGSVSTIAALDYEEASQYQISIVAQDNGKNSLPAYAKLVVRVMDLNDHAPEITVNTLTADGNARVVESAAIGTFVAHISVSDKDGGVSGTFHCSMDSDNFELQQLYETEFKIVTTVIFDREIQEMYHVNLVCKDSGAPSLASTRHITVTVQDLNDNAPQFSRKVYKASLAENNAAGASVITINASDNDAGNNAKLQYSLDDGQGVLTIDSVTGQVTALTQFDYETGKMYEFTLVVADEGKPPLSATARLHLVIRDTNDQPPVFIQESYTFQVEENSVAKTTIGQVEAADGDTGMYSEVTYLVQQKSQDVADVFSVDPESGEILLLTELDRENVAAYNFQILALNSDNTDLKSSVDVTIQVIDENDNPPVIEFPTMENNTLNVSNLVPVGADIGMIRAYDLDTGENSYLKYAVTNTSLFDINIESGRLRVAGNLGDVVYNTFTVVVMVSDSGNPRLESEATLYVTVDSALPYMTVLPPGGVLGRRNLILVCILVPVVLLVCLVITLLLVRRRRVKDENARRYNCRLEAQKKKLAALQRGSSASLEKPPKYRISGMDIGESSTDDFTDPNASTSTSSKDTDHMVRSKSQRKEGGHLQGCNNSTLRAAAGSAREQSGSPPGHNTALDRIETEVQKIISMREQDSASDEDSLTDSGRGPSEEGEHNTTRGSPTGSGSCSNSASHKHESSLSHDGSCEGRGLEQQVLPPGVAPVNRHGQSACSRKLAIPARGASPCKGLSVKNDTTDYHQNRHNLADPLLNRTPRPPDGGQGVRRNHIITDRPRHHRTDHRHSDNCQSYDTHVFSEFGPSYCSSPKSSTAPRRQMSDSSPAVRWACSNGYRGNHEDNLNDNVQRDIHKNQRHKDVIYPPRKDIYPEQAWDDRGNHPSWNGSPGYHGNLSLRQGSPGSYDSEFQVTPDRMRGSPGGQYQGPYCVTGTPVGLCIRDVVNQYLPDRTVCHEEESAADLSDGDTTTSGSYVVDPAEFEVEPRSPSHHSPHRDFLYI